jgi:uncharacterized protein
VVRDHVPAYLVGGWYDIFQRGEPLNFSGLQLQMGPWYHLTASSQDFDPTMLTWFDRWLKNEPTGIDQTTTPAHLYLLGADKHVDESQPPAGLKPTTWYFGAGPSGSGASSQNDGTLTQTAPTASTGADQILYLGANAPCSRELDQWSMGAFEDVAPDGTATPITTGALLGSQQSVDSSRSWTEPDGRMILPSTLTRRGPSRPHLEL